MNKIFICCLVFLICAPVFAATMCAQTDVISGVLDSQVNGTSNVANGNEWSVSFPYGTVWGVSACINVPSSWAVAVNSLQDSNGKTVIGGERTGVYGWCQMTHPLKSGWMGGSAFASIDACVAGAAGDCSWIVLSSAWGRGNLFNTIGN